MKAMRVLNCTKEDREIIFKIADRVGCPVFNPDTFLRDNRIKSNPHIIFDGEELLGGEGEQGNEFLNISFSDFITELLKYEKPKVWVVKDGKEWRVEINFRSGYTEYTHHVYGCHRNPKFTYEVEE